MSESKRNLTLTMNTTDTLHKSHTMQKCKLCHNTSACAKLPGNFMQSLKNNTLVYFDLFCRMFHRINNITSATNLV